MYYGSQSSVARFLIVFFTALALLPLYFGLEIFQSLFGDYLWRAHTARDWPQVPATVLKVDWVWHQAKSLNGGPYGKDMRVTIRYEYAYEGKSYQGDRVGFEPFAARNQDLYRDLEKAKRYKRAVKVWVNPGNPSDAVLDPTVGWIAIAAYGATGTLLAGIGFGLLLLLRRASWPSRKP